MRLGSWSILMLSCRGRKPPHSYSCHISVAGEPGGRPPSQYSSCKPPNDSELDTNQASTINTKTYPQAINQMWSISNAAFLELHHRARLPVIMYGCFWSWWLPSDTFEPVENLFERQQTIKHKARFVSQTINLLFTPKLLSNGETEAKPLTDKSLGLQSNQGGPRNHCAQEENNVWHKAAS